MEAPDGAEAECETAEYRPDKHARESDRHPGLAHKLSRSERP